MLFRHNKNKRLKEVLRRNSGRMLVIPAALIAITACLPAINFDDNYRGDISNSSIGYYKALRFIGAPATANLLADPVIPAHPYLAEQGRNGMHADSWSTGTYTYPGPLGNNPSVTSKSFGAVGGECATAVFDSFGRLISVCTDFTQMRLVMMHPDTLQVIAEHQLPLRESNKTLDLEEIMNDTSGGAYFHLLDGDRPIIANAERHIQIFSYGGGVWNIDKDYDLNPYLPDGYLVTDAVPDWDGNIWFVTRQGMVGVIDASTEGIKVIELSEPEEIQNSLSVAADGVFIVSDHALYRFEMNGSSEPVFTWRETYDRGTSIKPGAISQGSGTTPSLMEDDLVAIADNADGQINVEIFHRLDGYGGTRKICSIPVFRNNYSMTENSLIAYKRSVIIENNYGYLSPFEPVWTEPGVVRIDVRADFSGCDIVWESTEASQTTVLKLSTATGLVYLYTREPAEKLGNFGFNVGVDYSGDAVTVNGDTNVDTSTVEAQAWYLTAIDYETGVTRFKVFTGTGDKYNNNWAPITLGPNGAAYVGVLNGMIVVKDQ